MIRTQARDSESKLNQIREINFFTSYNPSLRCMNTLSRKHMSLLHSNDNLKTLFLKEALIVVYRRIKNRKKLLTPYLFPAPRREQHICNRCDIFKNCMVFSSKFVCTVTGKKCCISGNFTCNSTNDIYLVEWVNCKYQYVGSTTSFKQRFRIHKSDIKTNKDHFETPRHFNSICCHPINLHGYLKMHLIEKVFCDASKDIESILWEREEYW